MPRGGFLWRLVHNPAAPTVFLWAHAALAHEDDYDTHCDGAEAAFSAALRHNWLLLFAIMRTWEAIARLSQARGIAPVIVGISWPRKR